MGKKGIIKTFLGAIGAGSVIVLTGCPDLPNKFSLTPLISPLIIDEGQELEAGFRVNGHSLEDIIIDAKSEHYHEFDFSKISPDKISVNGSPIDSNYNGPTTLEVGLTNLEGKRVYHTLPVNVINTIDVTFLGFPTQLQGKQGMVIELITGDLLDDYSKLGNGLGVEITSPNYTAQNIVYLDDHSFSFSLVPKGIFEGETYVLIKGFDNEGNVEYLQIPMNISGVSNLAPFISIEDDISMKEGGEGSVNVKIMDEDNISDLEIIITSEKLNVFHEIVDENSIIIHCSSKDYYYNGPETINVYVEDTKGAVSQKNINVTITPMTDISYLITDMNFTFYSGTDRIKGHNLNIPASQISVEAFLVPVIAYDSQSREIIVDRESCEKIKEFETTEEMLKFKVEPYDRLEKILEIHFLREGYGERYALADISSDNLTRNLIFAQSTRQMNAWFAAVNNLLDEPIVPEGLSQVLKLSGQIDSTFGIANNPLNNLNLQAGGSFKIPKALAKWPFDVVDRELPEAVIAIGENQDIPQFYIDQVVLTLKELFSSSINIRYVEEFEPPFENKINIEFFNEPYGLEAGMTGAISYPDSNQIFLGILYFNYGKADSDLIKRVVNEEILTLRTLSSEFRKGTNIDSCMTDGTYISYPNRSPLDEAGLVYYTAKDNLLPGATARFIGSANDSENEIILYENFILSSENSEGGYYVLPERR